MYVLFENSSDNDLTKLQEASESSVKVVVNRWKYEMNRQLTAIIKREGEGYVALCPKLDIASQGDTVTLARDGLAEALTLFFGCAPTEEVERCIQSEVYITRVEVFGSK